MSIEAFRTHLPPMIFGLCEKHSLLDGKEHEFEAPNSNGCGAGVLTIQLVNGRQDKEFVQISSQMRDVRNGTTGEVSLLFRKSIIDKSIVTDDQGEQHIGGNKKNDDIGVCWITKKEGMTKEECRKFSILYALVALKLIGEALPEDASIELG